MHMLQVQKMSEDDGGAYHRALYALNVSSSLNLAGEEMPEPVRLVGDVIRFNRCASGHEVLLQGSEIEHETVSSGRTRNLIACLLKIEPTIK